jgi:hypothetical protein
MISAWSLPTDPWMVQGLYCGGPLQRLNMEELQKQMTLIVYGKGLVENHYSTVQNSVT